MAKRLITMHGGQPETTMVSRHGHLRIPAWLTIRLAVQREQGQTSVEYAVVVVGVALALAAIIASGVADSVFNTFWTHLQSAL